MANSPLGMTWGSTNLNRNKQRLRFVRFIPSFVKRVKLFLKFRNYIYIDDPFIHFPVRSFSNKYQSI